MRFPRISCCGEFAGCRVQRDGAGLVADLRPHHVTTTTYKRVLQAVNDAGCQFAQPKRDSERKIVLGSVTLRLFPQAPEEENENNNSIGIRLDFGEFSALLTGDSEKSARSWWMKNPAACNGPSRPSRKIFLSSSTRPGSSARRSRARTITSAGESGIRTGVWRGCQPPCWPNRAGQPCCRRTSHNQLEQFAAEQGSVLWIVEVTSDMDVRDREEALADHWFEGRQERLDPLGDVNDFDPHRKILR